MRRRYVREIAFLAVEKDARAARISFPELFGDADDDDLDEFDEEEWE